MWVLIILVRIMKLCTLIQDKSEVQNAIILIKTTNNARQIKGADVYLRIKC